MEGDFTLKIVGLDTDEGRQLEDNVHKYLREYQLKEEDVSVIKPIEDSSGYYIRFFNSRDNLESFVEFHNGKEKNWEVIETLDELNGELPGRLFIGGLPINYTWWELQELFEPFGVVESCKVVLDEFGVSRSFGFVNYKSRSEAEAGILGVNEKVVAGSALVVNHHVSKRERLRELENKRRYFHSVCVRRDLNSPKGGERSSLSKTQLMNMFKVFGEVEGVVMPKAGGYAFVNFKYHEDAKGALNEMNGVEYDGGKIHVSRAEHKKEREQYEMLRAMSIRAKCHEQMMMGGGYMFPRGLPIPGPRQQESNLYVSHLPPDFCDEDLRSVFCQYGEITSVKVITWQEGEDRPEGVDLGDSKGFGFICFRSPLEASNALVNMNGYRLNSRWALQVGFALRREDKAEHWR